MNDARSPKERQDTNKVENQQKNKATKQLLSFWIIKFRTYRNDSTLFHMRLPKDFNKIMSLFSLLRHNAHRAKSERSLSTKDCDFGSFPYLTGRPKHTHSSGGPHYHLTDNEACPRCQLPRTVAQSLFSFSCRFFRCGVDPWDSVSTSGFFFPSPPKVV